MPHPVCAQHTSAMASSSATPPLTASGFCTIFLFPGLASWLLPLTVHPYTFFPSSLLSSLRGPGW